MPHPQSSTSSTDDRRARSSSRAVVSTGPLETTAAGETGAQVGPRSRPRSAAPASTMISVLLNSSPSSVLGNTMQGAEAEAHRGTSPSPRHRRPHPAVSSPVGPRSPAWGPRTNAAPRSQVRAMTRKRRGRPAQRTQPVGTQTNRTRIPAALRWPRTPTVGPSPRCRRWRVTECVLPRAQRENAVTELISGSARRTLRGLPVRVMLFGVAP
jgi:hypothetical protein